MNKGELVKIGRIEVIQCNKSRVVFNQIKEQRDPETDKTFQVWDMDKCILIYKSNLLKYKQYLAKKHKGEILIEYKYLQK